MAEIPIFPRVSHFKTTEAFQGRLAELRLDIPLDDRILTAEEGSPIPEPAVLVALQRGLDRGGTGEKHRGQRHQYNKGDGQKSFGAETKIHRRQPSGGSACEQ